MKTRMTQMGRFMQRDPAGYVDGANLYGASLANPITHTDPLGLWEYAPGFGTFHVTMTAPGVRGQATSDIDILWMPNAKKMKERCFCSEIRFVQIYFYTKNGVSLQDPLTTNAWTWDSDAFYYSPTGVDATGKPYPNDIPGLVAGPNQGKPRPASMTDSPGWGAEPNNRWFTSTTFDAETCAVCSKTGGLKAIKGDEEELVFGCFRWGHAQTYHNSDWLVMYYMFYVDSQWKNWTRPAGNTADPPSQTIRTSLDGYPPSPPMVAELNKRYNLPISK